MKFPSTAASSTSQAYKSCSEAAKEKRAEKKHEKPQNCKAMSGHIWNFEANDYHRWTFEIETEINFLIEPIKSFVIAKA